MGSLAIGRFGTLRPRRPGHWEVWNLTTKAVDQPPSVVCVNAQVGMLLVAVGSVLSQNREVGGEGGWVLCW